MFYINHMPQMSRRAFSAALAAAAFVSEASADLIPFQEGLRPRPVSRASASSEARGLVELQKIQNLKQEVRSLSERYSAVESSIEQEIEEYRYFPVQERLAQNKLKNFRAELLAYYNKGFENLSLREREECSRLLNQRENKQYLKGLMLEEFKESALLKRIQDGARVIELKSDFDPTFLQLHYRQGDRICREIFKEDVMLLKVTQNLAAKTTVLEEYDRYAKPFRAYTFREYPEGRRLEEVLYYWPEGTSSKLVYQDLKLNYFDREGKKLLELNFSAEGEIVKRRMFDLEGRAFGSYKTELHEGRVQSFSQYMEMLSVNLDTLEKDYLFIKYLNKYVRDGDVSYMQTARETAERDIGDAMAGNCLDTAQFMLEKEKLRGNNPFILSIGDKVHAACIVLSESNGRFFAKRYCSVGVSFNGNDISGPQDPAREWGFETPLEALNSVVENYRFSRLKLKPGERFKLSDELVLIELAEEVLSHKRYTRAHAVDLIRRPADLKVEYTSISKGRTGF